jgi:hypothetical protein
MTDILATLDQLCKEGSGEITCEAAQEIRKLRAEIERLKAERAGDQQRLFHYEAAAANNADLIAELEKRLSQLVYKPLKPYPVKEEAFKKAIKDKP